MHICSAEVMWGMNIYERDEDGGEEQDLATADVVRSYNTFGVTELCIGRIKWNEKWCILHTSCKLL